MTMCLSMESTLLHVSIGFSESVHNADREAILKKYTDNVEAYQLYLQGRFFYDKYTSAAFMKAIGYFQAATAKDSNYAIAYSGLAFCYRNLTFMNWSTS